MKRNILSILLTLVLALSLCLVTAVPAAAADPSTFTVTDGTYTTAWVDDENGNIAATLTGAWGDTAVIGEFSATGEGGLYLVPAPGPSPPDYGTTATVSVSGTLSADEITFSGTAVRTVGDPITDDEVTGIAGTITIQPDGAVLADLSGTVMVGEEPMNADIDISGPMLVKGYVFSGQSIQDAIDAANTGDTILISSGTYVENLIFDGDEADDLTITSSTGVADDVTINGYVHFNNCSTSGLTFDSLKFYARAYDKALFRISEDIEVITHDRLAVKNCHIVRDPTPGESYNEPASMVFNAYGVAIGNDFEFVGNRVEGFQDADFAVLYFQVYYEDDLYEDDLSDPVNTGWKINGNIFINCGGVAIAAYDQDGIEVKGNTVNYSEVTMNPHTWAGIYVQRARDVTSPSPIVIGGNTVIGPGKDWTNSWVEFEGILVGHADNSQITGNTVSNCYLGIGVLGDDPATAPENATISGNTLSENTVSVLDMANEYARVDNGGSIQAAIDMCWAGYTVNVEPGTYLEHILIDEALTVRSTDGAKVTIIDSNAYRYKVTIEHSDVTFEGFTVTDPNYAAGSDATGILIHANYDEDVSNVKILNNIITQIRSETGTPSYFGPCGINIGFAVTKGNTLSDIVISGNTITDIKNPSVYTSSCSADHTCGINIWDGAEDVEISNNDISDIKFNGIILEHAIDVRMVGNSITKCPTGIRVQPSVTVSDVRANFNNIDGNTEYGLLSNVPIDATNNWWGDVTGPQPEGIPGYESYGDKVSTGVDYNPWLLEKVVPGDPVLAPFDKTMALKKGWTLVSPDSAITESSFVSVGGEPLFVLEYTEGGFVTELSPPSPLKAIYVKTKSGGVVGVNYAEVGPDVIYSKDLVAGWNLISVPSTTASTQAILAQLRYATIGTQQGVGLTTLVSQGEYNQNTDSFQLPTLTDAQFDALPGLSPLDGYWAHLEAAEVFEVIP